MAVSAGGRDRRRWPGMGIAKLVRHFEPLTLVGIVLSIGVAIALDMSPNVSTGESVVAGLVGTTLSLVLDASARAERRFELRRLVGDLPWLGQELTSMAQSVREIVDRYPDSMIESEMRRRLKRVCDDLDELRRGRIMGLRSDHDELISCTETCKGSIEAVTNIAEEPTWWQSAIGERYWKANLDALARGVTITRVFVCDRLGPDLLALVQMQRQAGVRVTVVDRHDVDASLHLNVVVWDGQRAWEGRTNAWGQIYANVLVVNPTEVDRIHGIYRTCAAANPMPGI